MIHDDGQPSEGDRDGSVGTGSGHSPKSAWGRLRERIEAGLSTWGHRVYRHPWRTLWLCAFAVGALGSQLPHFEIDTSNEGFLEPDDPVRLRHDAFRRQFGSEDVTVVAIQTDEVFDFEFLDRMRSLHEALEDEVPHLGEVTSLVNVRNTRGVGDELRVDDFLEDWPESAAELADLRERAIANPLYRGVLLAEDATLAAIMVEGNAFSSLGQDDEALAGFDDASPAEDDGALLPLTGPENSDMVRSIEDIVARYQAPDFQVHVAGPPVMEDRIMGRMLEDMSRLTALSLVVVAGFLAFLFRSATAVALALGTSALAVFCALAFMAAVGIPLTTASQILPSFVLAISVGNCVHLLAIFLQQRGLGRDAEDALAYSLGHSGLAIVMTGLTTAGSLVSFLSAELAIVADFGVVGPGAALIALALSLVLLPALIAIAPPSARVPNTSFLRRFPRGCGVLAARYPIGMLAGWLVLFGISFVGASQLRFSNYALGWFPREDPFRIAMELIDDRLGGADSIELVIDSGRENGLYEPELLGRIEAAQRLAEGQPIGGDIGVVGKTTISIVQVVKEIHKALNANQPGFYRIPDDRELVAQELFLFESSGTDDLEDVVDSQFRYGRVSIKLPVVDSIYGTALLVRLEREFDEIFGATASAAITGSTSIGARTISAMVHSVARTYLLAFAIITPFMIVLLGSVRTGLLSMVPAMGSILVTLGVMGWTGLRLEAFTLLTGCIALGLAVDDTIHFMHNYARAREAGASPEDAVRVTLESTGQALFFTSLVLAAGFLIYTQASLSLLFNFGLTTTFAISLAFLANVTLAPALVTLVARWRGEPQPSRAG